jgi:hypothetical protein
LSLARPTAHNQPPLPPPSQRGGTQKHVKTFLYFTPYEGGIKGGFGFGSFACQSVVLHSLTILVKQHDVGVYRQFSQLFTLRPAPTAC